MEKYRKWTDQTAGVNPFVAANTQKIALTVRILSFIIGMIKGLILVLYIPTFFILYSLPLAFIKQKSAGFLLLLFGVSSQQDYALTKIVKSTANQIILSNHTCFIDVIYFLYKFPGCSFIGFSENEKEQPLYYLISPFKAFTSLFTSLQPFYKINSQNTYSSLKELYISNNNLQSRWVVVFYEKIRTNGRGTIKIQKSLSQELYQLERDLIIVQIKYTLKKDDLISLTTSALHVLFAGLEISIPSNNIKIRALKLGINLSNTDNKQTHSANELRQSVCSMSLGTLTKPASYFQFYEFYKKTQREGYKLV